MKKINRLISVLLLCAILVSSAALLSSCSLKKPEKIWTTLKTNMDELSSYKAKISIDMTVYSGETAVKGTGDGFLIEVARGDAENYYYMQSLTTTVDSESIDVKKSVKDIEAYYDGKHFIIHGEGEGSEHKIYGESTAEGFIKYISGRDDFSFDLSTSQRIERKGRTLTFSDFPKYVISDISREFGVDAAQLGIKVKSLSVNVTYNKDMLVTQMDYSFVFEANDEGRASALSARVEYSQHNSAEREYINSPLSAYTKIEYFSEIRDAVIELERLKTSEEQTLNMSVMQHLNVDGSSRSYDESDKITYGGRKGGFFYDIEATVGKQTMSISYDDGKRVIESGGTPEESDQTEAEARAYIEELLLSGRFNLKNVVSVTKDPDDIGGTQIYMLTLGDFDTSSYQSLAASVGLSSYENFKHQMTIQFKDGKLRYISSSISFESDTSGKARFSLTVMQRFILESE